MTCVTQPGALQCGIFIFWISERLNMIKGDPDNQDITNGKTYNLSKRYSCDNIAECAGFAADCAGFAQSRNSRISV